MPKKRTPLDRFADLTWNDLEEWYGSEIVSRGKQYQRQGRVCELAVATDAGVIAWEISIPEIDWRCDSSALGPL